MDFFSVIAWVEGAIDSLASWAYSIIIAVYDALASAINAVWDALVGLAQFLGDVFSSISDWLDDLWWEYIIPFVEWCQQIIDDITTWLANFFDPLITFVQRILAWYQTYIFPILHAILEVIQRVRVILTLFRLLGFAWAKKLDADLQLIQNWVTEVIATVTQTINTISTVLGLIVDPTGIIRRDFFSGTLFSSLGAVKRAVGSGTDRASTPGEVTQAANNNALVIGDAPLGKINADGTVTYQQGMAPVRADVDAGYASIGVSIYAS